MTRKKNRATRSSFVQPVENLEHRQLLSTSVAWEGTSGDDNFAVAYNPMTMIYSFTGGSVNPAPVSATDFAGFNLAGISGNDTLTVSGGNPTLLNNVGTDGTSFSLTVSSGVLAFASSEDLASISIGSGATAQMLGSNHHVLATSALVFAGVSNSWQGQLDLGSNDLIVHGGDLPTITNQLKEGYSNGGWNGAGGIISSAATNDSTHLSALGVVSNDNGSGGANFNAFSGEKVAATDILLKYTYYGDATLDGKVDGSDYSRIDSAYLADLSNSSAATGWFNGDFNYDGAVNGSDYTLIDNAFNSQGAAVSPVGLSSPTSAEIDITLSDTSGSTVEGYDIYRSTTSAFTADQSSLVVFSDSPSFQDSGLQPATQYFYIVQAVHFDASRTTVGAEVSATTLASDSNAPLQPTDLVAEGVNSSDVDLNWTDNSNNETGFLVEYSPQGQNNWSVADVAPAHSTGDTVFELSQNSDYDFRVTAINSVVSGPGAVSPLLEPAVTPATTQATTQSVDGKDIFVALIGGNLQTQAYLIKGDGQGVGAIAKILRDHHSDYDVHVYASYKQENVKDDGTGKALDEVLASYNSGIRNWALIGYSHGAGSGFALDQKVHAQAVLHQPVPLRLIYSAYIAGVSHTGATDMASQTTPPVDSTGHYFANWYEDNDALGVHSALGGTAHDHLVHTNDDGSDTHHTSIDKQLNNLQLPLANEAVMQITANLGG